MCIPLGSFTSSPLVLTAKGMKLRKIMNVIFVIHLAFSISKMFILNPFSAIGDLICCGILYCGLSSLNFCQLLSYMIFCLYNSFSLSVTLGYMIQTGQYSVNNIQGSQINTGFLITFIATILFFYCVDVYFSFQTYKEFKAMHHEQLGDDESASIA